MEIRRWLCYVVINCALILPFVAAKPFSINEALAAESKLKKTRDTAPSPISSGSIATIKSPLLKSKNIFEIGSSRLKALLSPLRKHKTQSKKREIYKNDKLDEKYFPLFKNLGLLFDNLLDSEPRDSYEVSKHKYKRYKFKGDERRGIVCSCARKSDSEAGETRSHKKTAVSTEAPTTEKPTTPAAAAADTAVAGISGLGSDKDVSALLPRDPSGGRRDYNGHSERSSPTFYPDAQRNLARNYGNRKHHSRIGENEADAECDEEDTDGHPRDDASGAEPRGRGRGTPNVSSERIKLTEGKQQKNKKANVLRGHTYELPRKIKLKTRRNETESDEFLPKYIRGARGSVSENNIGDITESLQSEENYKEDIDSVAFPSADDQRVTGGGGEPSTENQEVRPRDETVISIGDLTNKDLALQQNPKVKTPSVTIFDGYSVARDKNGQNKLTEKTIRIHG
ncbi:hypothetical protein ABMA28_001032 [Loxostege sticticalis]|uniref:Uncharacterized protein n=1 Tax=Loxostege sticticalis TaxID=481309 RepID=A0ABD0T752_LOXSC